jgi:hypothetical protein
MFGRDSLKVLGLICLVLPFIGCSSTQIDAITVTPTTTTFDGLGGHVQLKAIATINHGGHPATYEDVTDQVSWSTPLVSVLTISSTGDVTITGTGLTQVIGTINGFPGVVSGSATVCAQLVNPPSGGFTCAGASAAVKRVTKFSLVQSVQAPAAPGETRQFLAVRTSDEGGQQDLTGSVTWTSSDQSVATVNESGMVTALSHGTTTIMASVTNSDRTVVAAAANLIVKE